MATKAQLTEYLNDQWEKGENDANVHYWTDALPNTTATRLGLMQNWMSPKIAVILKKLVGDAIMIERLANNGSNNDD